MDNLEAVKNKGSVKNYFKKGGLIYSFITLLVVAAIIFFNYTYRVLGVALENKKTFIFTVSTLGYIMIIITYYVLLSPKLKSTFYVSCMGVGLIASSALFAVYIALVLEVFTLVRILVVAGLFLLGLLYILLANILGSKGEVKYGYYLATVKKFSFIGIFGLTTFISSIYYLISNRSFINKITRSSNGATPVLIILYIFLALMFLSAVISVSSKKIEILDMFLVAAAMAIPVNTLIAVFINNAAMGQVIFNAVSAGVVLLFLILRKYVFFRKETIGAQPDKAGYLRAFSYKYGFFAAMAIGVGAFLIAYTFISGSFVVTVWKVLSGKRMLTAAILPVFYVVISTGALVAIGFTISIFTLKSKRVSFGDFFNVVCIALSAVAIPYTFISLSIVWLRIAICVFITISLIVLISRLRSVWYK